MLKALQKTATSFKIDLVKRRFVYLLKKSFRNYTYIYIYIYMQIS